MRVWLSADVSLCACVFGRVYMRDCVCVDWLLLLPRRCVLVDLVSAGPVLAAASVELVSPAFGKVVLV